MSTQENQDSSSTITYTFEQQCVIERLKQWAISPQSDVMILTGAAGTGKSVVIGAFCALDEIKHKSILLTAPTGSASYNLQRRIGRPVSTLHSQLYKYRGIVEKEDDFFMLEFAVNESLAKPDVIIIDEAGMIGDQEQAEGVLRFGSGRLLHDLIHLCRKYTTPPKLLFVGDRFQLTPINQRESPCLSAEYLKDVYNLTVEQCDLTEIKRQNNPYLLSTVTYLREKLEKKDESAFSFTDEAPKGLSADQLASNIVQSNPLRNPFQSVVIAYTNSKVSEYNRNIRNAYGFDDTLNEGDLLLSIRTVYDDQSTVLTNGTMLKVERVSPLVESRSVSIRVKNEGEKRIELRFRTAEIRICESDSEQTVPVKILENALMAETSTVGEHIWRALYVDFLIRNKTLYEERKRSRCDTELYQKWLTKFSHALRKDVYFNAVMAKYAYSITGHRAQGHEWQKVVVDVDYSKNNNSIEALRWIYTACTRTTKELLFVNKEKTNFMAGCKSIGLDLLTSIPAGFYATKHIKVDTSDHPNVQQFPFIKPFIEKLKAVEYRLNANVAITHGNYFIRTVWIIGDRIIPIDFGYSKKGMKELSVKMDLYEKSSVYRDLIREIQSNDDVLDIPKSITSIEASFRKRLLEANQLYATRLCNVVYKSEYQTDYYLENEEGKGILTIWNNEQNRITKMMLKTEKGPSGRVYSKLMEYLLTL